MIKERLADGPTLPGNVPRRRTPPRRGHGTAADHLAPLQFQRHRRRRLYGDRIRSAGDRSEVSVRSCSRRMRMRMRIRMRMVMVMMVVIGRRILKRVRRISGGIGAAPGYSAPGYSASGAERQQRVRVRRRRWIAAVGSSSARHVVSIADVVLHFARGRGRIRSHNVGRSVAIPFADFPANFPPFDGMQSHSTRSMRIKCSDTAQ